MNIADARADLGAVARAIGFNAWDYQPDDPQSYPAAVVGGVRSIHRLNRFVSEVELVVTLYANLADAQDATRTLDRAVSVGTGDTSYIDMLDSVTPPAKPAWQGIRFTSAGPYQRYSMPGGLVALGVEIVLTLTG